MSPDRPRVSDEALERLRAYAADHSVLKSAQDIRALVEEVLAARAEVERLRKALESTMRLRHSRDCICVECEDARAALAGAPAPTPAIGPHDCVGWCDCGMPIFRRHLTHEALAAVPPAVDESATCADIVNKRFKNEPVAIAGTNLYVVQSMHPHETHEDFNDTEDQFRAWFERATPAPAAPKEPA